VDSTHSPHPPDEGLNPAQREAVRHPGGPLLILAGAGSGKTRVITHRIAWLILERGVWPSRITAVTFTNKAAAEMRARIDALLGAGGHGGWIGTFHALCLRILRRDGERIGLLPGFNVYDTDDQLALVKRLLKDERADDEGVTPRAVLSRISRAKNTLQSPEELLRRAFHPEARLAARVFAAYQDALRRANAADFDDLLVRTLDLLREHPDVAERLASRTEHLLVDEYQDTNRPQYLLVRALSAAHGNVCVVGDEDQSIYRFRGAELRNILEFEADHPGARVIRLEQNYRSTGTILRAAGAVVARNVRRKGKSLWTENPDGSRIELYRAFDDRGEAAWVARRVAELARTTPLEGQAVLYRTNAQSRLLEEALRDERIPYQLVGATQFYARKEIKDLLAYLRLAANPADDVAFRRAVNTPPRGVGATTIELVEAAARASGLPLMEAAGLAIEERRVGGRSAAALLGFLRLAADLARAADTRPPAELLTRVIDETGYAAFLDRAYPGLGAERMENVQSLVSAAAEHAEGASDATLESFLDRTALVADADEVGARPGVTLMTIHCAKGLEFPVVFLIGLEEDLFPHPMAGDADDDIEEERRLCYVALTRARERLLLAHARLRRIQGALLPHRPSRFLDEIPAALIDEVAPAGAPGQIWEPSAWSASSAALAGARHAPAAPPPPTRPAARPALPAADGYDVGKLVLHPRFGEGRILGREGEGAHLKLTIHFGDHGAKKILPAYTRLRVELRS